MSSMLVTVGLALDIALQRGLQVDVQTTTGSTYADVLVGAVDQYCVILLDGTKAHVVAREHLVSVSLEQNSVLELTTSDTLESAGQGAHR